MQAELVAVVADHFGVDPATVHAGTRFAEDLKADSLGMIDLVFSLETHFEVALDSDEETPATVGELASVLERHFKEVRGH